MNMAIDLNSDPITCHPWSDEKLKFISFMDLAILEGVKGRGWC